MHWLALKLVHLLLTGVSILAVAKILPGIRVESFKSAVVLAFFVAVLNLVAWGLLAPITLPLKWLTLGVAGFFINGVVLMLAGGFVRGVQISGCLTASIAAFGITLANEVIRLFLGRLAP